MRGVQLKDRKNLENFMPILGPNKTIEKMAKASIA